MSVKVVQAVEPKAKLTREKLRRMKDKSQEREREKSTCTELSKSPGRVERVHQL